MVRFDVGDEHAAPVEDDGASEMRRHVVKHDELHIVSSECVRERGAQAEPCVEPCGGRRQGVVVEQHSKIHIALAVSALLLLDNGYRCTDALVYNAATKQRVRIPVDEALRAESASPSSFRRRRSAAPLQPLTGNQEHATHEPFPRPRTYTDLSLCPSFNFLVVRYRFVNSEAGISSGSHSATDRP